MTDTIPQTIRANSRDVGIVFVGPIIGMTPSLMATFAPFADHGVAVEGVDIFDDVHEKKSFFKVLGLTMFPGKGRRLAAFANRFDEHAVFDKIDAAIRKLRSLDKTYIVLGGMSGGFVFASRIVQVPTDEDLQGHPVLEHRAVVVKLFGVSPIIFYPPEIRRMGAKLRDIPTSIPTLLIFGDQDHILPEGTLRHCQEVAGATSQVRVLVLRHEELGSDTPVRHQFFGGRDFIGFLKNRYWHPVAQQRAVQEIDAFVTENNPHAP